ncbi:MAG: hypothetical protein KAQ94_06125 [Arcobacteraceae bacterium]|nr:hypothetical protein [Arcobacteraceae bacterium]
MDELAELKRMYLELKAKVEALELTTYKEILLTDLARELDIHRQTLTYYVKSNFEPEVDFYKKNNKIYLDVSILCRLRKHYAK